MTTFVNAARKDLGVKGDLELLPPIEPAARP